MAAASRVHSLDRRAGRWRTEASVSAASAFFGSRSSRNRRLDGPQRSFDLRLGLSYFCATAKFRAASGWVRRFCDQCRLDAARSIAALCDFVCRRSISEQSVVAATMVHERPRRRVDCISRFAPKSDRRPDDFLADRARLGGNDFFCDLLLSRKCWSILELGLAVNLRSSRPRFHKTIPSWHARVVDKHAYCDYRRSCCQYVAYGPVECAFVADCPLYAT